MASARKRRRFRTVRLGLDVARLRVDVGRNAGRDELGRDARGDVGVDARHSSGVVPRVLHLRDEA
jgi:hypothetical protein